MQPGNAVLGLFRHLTLFFCQILVICAATADAMTDLTRGGFKESQDQAR